MELIKAVILFFGIFVAVCSGLPASKKDEVEEVTPVKSYGDQPIVDTGLFSGWESPFSSNPFGGLFDGLEGIMQRMRQQIASLLKNFPVHSGNGTSIDDNSPFPIGLGHPSFADIGGIDLSKGNTTSITKVIDGHTVVINETEYKNEDDFGGTFFKVRIIDVKPDSSELTTEKEAEPVSESVRDREEVANSMENEIIKSKEAEANHSTATPSENITLFESLRTDPFENIETFDEAVSTSSTDNVNSEFGEWGQNSKSEWNNVEAIDSVETNDIDGDQKEGERPKPVDLSRDTYVNEIAARNGTNANPDAEVFVVENIRQSERMIDPR